VHPRIPSGQDVRRVTVRALSPEDLRRRGDEWDLMVRTAARPSPFLLSGYVAPWVEHFTAPARSLLLAAEAGDRIVGGLPLVVHRRCGVDIARWVGGAEATPADLLLAPDAPAATVAALRAAAGGAADLAMLAGLGASSHAGTAGSLALIERTAGPVMSTGPDWDAVYAERVSTRTRETHRKHREQLERAGSLEVVVARDAALVARYLPEAFAVHAGRERRGADRSTFGTAAGRGFHLAAGPALAEAGAALLVVVRLDDAPVAYQYALLAGRSMCLFQAGHVAPQARHNPALLATLTAMEAASRAGATRIELTGSGDGTPSTFADRNEPTYEGIGWADGPRGRMVAAIATAALRGRHRTYRLPRLRMGRRGER
jgi:CelD/BcsL family acetyltransferase involved in cellulose biosynthesis